MASQRDQWRSRVSFVCLLLVCTHLVFSSAIGTSWWALGVSDCSLRSSGNCPGCNKLVQDRLLNDAQRRICQNDDERAIIKAISRGARKAIIDCQSRFKNLKWNCSTFYGENLFGSFINNGTRETAILYAYLSAGATQGVAEACHEQRIEDCPCQITGESRKEDAQGNIVFNTCDDNFEWALNLVKNFVGISATTQTNTTRELIDEHNSNLGRTILNNRTTSCVCHGISGTCSIQTCYQKVPDVGVVGSQLQFKYNGAVKVKMDATTKNLVPVRPDIDQNITSDLVYMGDSPDFCRQTTQDGVLGTKDRICIPDSESLNSCNILCCGRGHYRKVSVVRAPPRCEFVWCCRFECVETGNHTIIEHRCN